MDITNNLRHSIDILQTDAHKKLTLLNKLWLKECDPIFDFDEDIYDITKDYVDKCFTRYNEAMAEPNLKTCQIELQKLNSPEGIDFAYDLILHFKKFSNLTESGFYD